MFLNNISLFVLSEVKAKDYMWMQKHIYVKKYIKSLLIS